ncbi:MAG: hypothetical protein GC191_18470 [Azospirillum sp.]|nr:hypothetical protein [Azospirillum sp.]
MSPDGKTLSVFVPMTLRRRGGRKLIIRPEGADDLPSSTTARPDNALVKAIARAHRWKRMLDSGKYASIRELAEAEKISDRYLARLLQLTLLAPDIIERILDGRLPKGIGLAQFMEPWPAVWKEQRKLSR